MNEDRQAPKLNPLVEDLLERHKEDFQRLCKQFHIQRLRLFGSGTRDDWSPLTSDLDFLAEYDGDRRQLSALDSLVGLQTELSSTIGLPVDAVDWAAAQNPYFKELAESTAVEIFTA